jgi:replicative DNA helicase
MKRQVGSVLVDSDEITHATCPAERHPGQRTDKRPLLSDLRESGCLTANKRILRADTGAEVTLGELMRVGERPLDERERMIARPMTNVFYSGRREVFNRGWRQGRRWRRRGTIRS